MFRGRRDDLIKVLCWDGQGRLCLFAKRLDRGHFLAAGQERRGVAHSGTAVDAAGEHRLAHAARTWQPEMVAEPDRFRLLQRGGVCQFRLVLDLSAPARGRPGAD